MNKQLMRWLLVSGLVIMAFNLRTPITSIGPVLEEIRESLHMSAATAGLLTGVPCFAFGLIGLVTPKISYRLGLHPTLLLAMVCVTGGVIGRAIVHTSISFLLLSTIALTGIALLNVLLPAFLKSHFPQRIASMTTIYTVTMGVGTVVSAAVVAPLALRLSSGWRGATGMWGLIAATAIIPLGLLIWARIHDMAIIKKHSVSNEDSAKHLPPKVTQEHVSSLWRLRYSAKARAMVVFFGFQSLHGYVQMGWLAQFFRDQGADPVLAGTFVALIQLMIIPGGLLAPMIYARAPRPEIVVVFFALLIVPGYAGLFWAPMSAPWLWVMCLAVSNFCFPIALLMIGQGGRTAQTTAELSAFVQGIGYFLAGLGPLFIGILYSATGQWTWPMIVLLATAPVFAYYAYRAGTVGYVDDDLVV